MGRKCGPIDHDCCVWKRGSTRCVCACPHSDPKRLLVMVTERKRVGDFSSLQRRAPQLELLEAPLSINRRIAAPPRLRARARRGARAGACWHAAAGNRLSTGDSDNHRNAESGRVCRAGHKPPRSYGASWGRRDGRGRGSCRLRFGLGGPARRAECGAPALSCPCTHQMGIETY